MTSAPACTSRALPRVLVATVLALAACVQPGSAPGTDGRVRLVDPAALALPSFVPPASPGAAADDRLAVVGVERERDMDAVRSRIERMGGVIRDRYLWGGYLVEMPAKAERGAFSASADRIPGVRYVTEQAYLYAADPGPAASGVAIPATPRVPPLTEPVLGAAFLPNDPHLMIQWGLYRIGCPDAWDVAAGGPVIAILDTGVDYTHPELDGAVLLGYDFIDDDWDPMDEQYHGTAMAGIAGAWTDNGIGGAGVAYESYLMAVRVLNEHGNGTAAGVAEGIVFAADHGADVINLSLSGPGTIGIEPLVDACAYARARGCVVVGASGNVAMGLPDSTRMYPAACDGVIGVGATTSATPDAVWSGTIHGTREDGTPVVTVCAPGMDIYGPYPGSMAAFYTGTSASTALVSGAAAVVWSAYPDATNDDIASILASSALDVAPAGRDVESGWGRIRLDQAVTYAAADAFEPRDPANLAAAWAPPGLAVDLTWDDNAASEVGYVLERAHNTTGTASFSHVATLPADTTSYRDSTGLDWSGTWYYRVRAFNAAGFSGWSNSAEVRLDTEPPVSTLLVDGLDPAGRWFRAPHAVSVTATDTRSGAAATWVDYRGGPELYGAPFSLPEGENHVRYWSVDNAGNVEASRTATVNVDVTSPTVSCDATTTPYRGTAVIRITASDALSGVDAIGHRIGYGSDVYSATVTLGPGTHILECFASDVAGNRSPYSAAMTITVLPTLTVHRFYRPSSGTHFYTSSDSEKDDVMARLAGEYVYEGPSYRALASNLGGAVPVYRFYNRRTATHFYTISTSERDNVLATMGGTYTLEGIAYHVLPAEAPDTSAVHRFFNRRTGVHFYTSSEQERAAVVATLSHVYTYEGVAFHVPR